MQNHLLKVMTGEEAVVGHNSKTDHQEMVTLPERVMREVVLFRDRPSIDHKCHLGRRKR